jgi:myosin heavy subunit
MCVSVFRVEQECIFRTLSAILSLGNAEFIDVTDETGSECAVIAENYLIARVAELLGEELLSSFLSALIGSIDSLYCVAS